MSSLLGAIIEQGPSDWQIIQQDAGGKAVIELSGTWHVSPAAQKNGTAVDGVYVRIVHESSAEPVSPKHDWTPAKLKRNGKWTATIKNIPAGGLYRIETQMRMAGDSGAPQWGLRGDMRHFIGVGDLWVIAGQSNSAGYGRGPVEDAPQLGVHLFNNAMRWTLATQPLNESTDTAHTCNRETGNPHHSPWLQWAKLVMKQVHHPVGLVQTSLGGSGMPSWNPTQPGGHELYDNMLDCVKAVGGRVRGVLWYQGESDASLKAGETYEERFIKMVAAWRKALDNSKLAWITVQLNRHFDHSPDEAHLGWSLVREAQRRAAHRVRNLAVVGTLDLTLSDLIHTSAPGNLALAQRAANAALGMVYGKNIAWQAPEVSGATYDDEARTVTLTFVNVQSVLQTIDVTQHPFVIEDKDGDVAIEKAHYPMDRTVVLHLARRIEGKAVVHGAPGRMPPIVPCDILRSYPILGFHNFPID
ncbi:MAG: hypothetical protein GC164_03100 [Phycisphaera sp.]|nr:hypothetical protein [Phycisphaera sp.]